MQKCKKLGLACLPKQPKKTTRIPYHQKPFIAGLGIWTGAAVSLALSNCTLSCVWQKFA